MKKVLSTWNTPRFTRGDIVMLLVSLFPLGLIRAFAYISETSENEGADVFYLVENTMRLQFWGLLFGVSLLILAVGITLRNHVIIWIGHALSALFHFVFMVGIVLTYLAYNVDLQQTLTYLSLLFTPYILHILFAMRMGPKPLVQSESSPVEIVVGDNGK